MLLSNFFVIIGGMGTLATEAFIHLLNKKTEASSDQDYLNYILINHASIPDRTAYLKDRTQENPITYLLEDINRSNLLEPEFIVITCNTAHAFHEELQKNTGIEILHMAKITVEKIKKNFPSRERIGFLGTEGSILSSVYKNSLEMSGYEIYYPSNRLQRKLNSLIYDEVKAKGNLNLSFYDEIINDIRIEGNLDTIILGCTELSWIYESHSQAQNDKLVLDAQSILVDYVIERIKNSRVK